MESNGNKRLELISLVEFGRNVAIKQHFHDPVVVGPWKNQHMAIGPRNPKAYDSVYEIAVGSFHTCTCHDLAAISFFRFIPGKGYRPRKLSFHHGDSEQAFKYVLLGQVTEKIYQPE